MNSLSVTCITHPSDMSVVSCGQCHPLLVLSDVATDNVLSQTLTWYEWYILYIWINIYKLLAICHMTCVDVQILSEVYDKQKRYLQVQCNCSSCLLTLVHVIE